jgi:hypothetical protein
VGTRAVFTFGFAKSDLDNIDEDDERDLMATARLTLGFSEAELDRLMALGEFEAVICHAQGTDEDLSWRNRCRHAWDGRGLPPGRAGEQEDHAGV